MKRERKIKKFRNLEKSEVRTHRVSHYFPTESKEIGQNFLPLTCYTMNLQLLKFSANLTQLCKCEQCLHGRRNAKSRPLLEYACPLMNHSQVWAEEERTYRQNRCLSEDRIK